MGMKFPLPNRFELIQLILARKQGCCSLQGMTEAPLAEIVATPFDQHSREFAGYDAVQKRNVFTQELFLQGYRVCLNDDFFRFLSMILALIGRGSEDGWDQVTKAFAHTRARFNN